ncbi:MAG: hypothetical protein JNK04_17595, partial [Myxococcales bacterium]|nr:hypothetical protein [Myxococcales bacterium]
MLLRDSIAALAALSFVACGPASSNQRWGPDTTERTSKPKAKASASAEAETEDEPAMSAEEQNQIRRAERVAARLLDGKVGWLPSKKAFLVLTAFSEEGTGTGTTAELLVERPDPNAPNEDGETSLCEPGAACDGDPDELLRAATDWVLDTGADSAVILEPVSFSAAAPSADIGAIGGKLVWARDHLDVVRPKKAPASLPKLQVEKEWTIKPIAAAPSPAGDLVLVLFDMDPGKKYSEGFNAFVETRLYKVP